MKNYPFLIILCLLLSTIMSCNKDSNLEHPENKSEVKSSTPLHEFNFDVEVNNNLLSFKTLAHFHDALTKISGTEKTYYTSEAIANWQERIGFKSMGLKYQTAMDKFKEVNSEDAYNQFIIENPNIKMSDDPEVDEVSLPVSSMRIAYVLNEEGKVMIGENLHMFNEELQFIAVGGDDNKLQKALETLESDKDQGFYVRKYIIDEVVENNDISANVRTGGCGISYDDQVQVGNKKVTSRIRLESGADPGPNLAFWSLFVDASFNGHSKKKNWRGQWKGYETWMEYYAHYSTCIFVNGTRVTPDPDRMDSEEPSNPTSGYTYFQRLASGTYSTQPLVTASFNFWIHRVKNNHDNIELDRWCF